MLTFLLICSSLLLVLSIVSYWQLFRMSAREVFAEWIETGMGYGGLQLLFALTGLYVFFALTVMNHVRPTLYLGLLTSVDSLLFLIPMYRFHKQGTLPGYYRSGVGVYLSGLLQIIFLVTTLYYLIPRVF